MIDRYLDDEFSSMEDGYFTINDIIYVDAEECFDSINKTGFIFKHLSIEYYMD